MLRMPPGGSGLSLRQILKSFGKSVDLQGLSDEYNFFLVKSGKDALLRVYSAISQNPIRIPAYSCPDLASPAIRAGKRFKLVDVDPASLLPVDEVHVSANLYGLVDSPSLIDDACQAGFSSAKNQRVGLRSEFGIFSAGRGKAFGAGGGGILAVKKNSSTKFNLDGAAKISANSPRSLLMALLYSYLENPLLFSPLAALPFLKIGQTIVDSDFESGAMSEVSASWLAMKLNSMHESEASFKRNTGLYLKSLSELSGISLPVLSREGESVLTRFPVIFKSPELREHVYDATKLLGASRSYPKPLNEILELGSSQAYPGAQEASRTILTFPTHRLVTTEHISRISESVKKCL